MIAFRRKTREARRHSRAVVRQELGAQAAADPRPDWEANKARSEALRRRAQREENPR